MKILIKSKQEDDEHECVSSQEDTDGIDDDASYQNTESDEEEINEIFVLKEAEMSPEGVVKIKIGIYRSNELDGSIDWKQQQIVVRKSQLDQDENINPTAEDEVISESELEKPNSSKLTAFKRRWTLMKK